MPTQANPSIQPRRTMTEFDVERSVYARLKSGLLIRAAGKFVVIAGDELIGPFETAEEAEQAGYAQLGPGPLYIKQILPDGPKPVSVHAPFIDYVAMTSQALGAEAFVPAEPRPGERPFIGYDRERAAYARLEPELSRAADGKYVVLVGDELEGPVDTYEEALRAGWQRFGLGPLYVKRLQSEDHTGGVTDDPSCPS